MLKEQERLNLELIFFVHVFIESNDLTDFVFMTVHKEGQ